MDLTAVVECAYATYEIAYRRFVDEQRSVWPNGSPEVKILLASGGGLYGRFCCIDFAAREDDWRLIEMAADSVEASRPAKGSMGGLAIVVEALTWNDLEIAWGAPALKEEVFAEWFERWFDPDDRRLDTTATLGGVIHSLRATPSQLAADLGSAPPTAFWELMTTLETAGVEAVFVRNSATARE